MAPSELDETMLAELLEAFYARVRQDEQLGPVFEQAVENWDDHLARLADFWSSLLAASGRYKGNPIAMHLIHADRITPDMFQRWLALWEDCTLEHLPPVLAIEAQARARRIALQFETTLRRRGTV